ncbi:MAG TPA: acyltransferase family protein, partial [bacterium]
LAVLLACLPVAWLVLLTDEFQEFGRSMAGGAAFVANFVFWWESGYFGGSALTKPLLHLWSLGIEEQFYIVWPLTLWLLWRFQVARLPVIALVAAASFGWNAFTVTTDPDAAFYSPLSRAWELLVGAALAQTALHSPGAAVFIRPAASPVARNALSLLGASSIALGITLLSGGIPYPGYAALLPVLGAAAVIAAGPTAWFNRTVLSQRVSVWFGLISFPLYLWHWPILSFARIVGAAVPGAGTRVGLVAVAVLLSWLTYVLVEKPLRFGPRGSLKAAALLAAMAALATIGGAMMASDGFGRKVLLSPTDHDPRNPMVRYDQRIQADPNYVIRERESHRKLLETSCFFAGKVPFQQFMAGLPDCVRPDSAKRNVLVIGDSHATDIWAALHLTHPTLHVMQVTAGNCPPTRYKEEGRCGEILRYAIEAAMNTPLDAVVLAGRWGQDYAGLAPLIYRLKLSRAAIFLVGPAFEYADSAYRLLSRRGTETDPVALSQRYRMDERIRINRGMKTLAAEQEVHFIDRIQIFCDSKTSCPLVSEEGELYILDANHLTRVGALRLGNLLLRDRTVLQYLR